MYTLRQKVVAGGALLLVTTLAGIGAASSSHAASGHAVTAAPTKSVQAKEVNNKYLFAPARVTVSKGTRVIWTNKTDAAHNVTLNNGSKVNKDFKPGKSVSVMFTKAGTYRYHCEYHPYMKGVVTVK